MTPPPGTLCRANQLLREGLARYAVPYVAVLARLQRHPIDGGVSPTKVRKVPQDSCQLPGRKGFPAIPELPRRDLV